MMLRVRPKMLSELHQAPSLRAAAESGRPDKIIGHRRLPHLGLNHDQGIPPFCTCHDPKQRDTTERTRTAQGPVSYVG